MKYFQTNNYYSEWLIEDTLSSSMGIKLYHRDSGIAMINKITGIETYWYYGVKVFKETHEALMNSTKIKQ